MSEALVISEVKAATAVITLNRADKRNALSRALIAELSAAFQRARDDPGVRSVILTAAGILRGHGFDGTG
jgi:methylglutaconyl-CoA hydratase